jgi:extracellular factor (EF) 3-hydroxypalmitic acid methyl ester biosynthesis protein
MSADPVEQVNSGGGTEVAVRKRHQRLRSNRLLLQGLLADQVLASALHTPLGRIEGHALDLSLHGARILVESGNCLDQSVMLGDRLDNVELVCGGAVIYRGAGTVVRTHVKDGALELAIDLEDAGIDLDAVYRSSARKSASERWTRTRMVGESAVVSPKFRAWVSDLTGFLEGARAFLDSEELTMETWDLATRNVVSDELLRAVAPDIIERLNLADHELRDLVSDLPKDSHADYRAFCHKHLGPYLSCSPFLHRARSKPLGYAGDYEMMNMLYRNHAEGSSLFGKAMNLYATRSPVAQANINRIKFLGEKIDDAIARSASGRVRIASIGCGPAQEITSFLVNRPELGHRIEVTLIDQEERAISYCERTLAPVAARTNAKVRVIRESIRRLLTDARLAQTLGTCDLIYSAGLFDYLNERTFVALLGTLYSAVRDGGVLAIGNVAAHNPNRWTMEYFTEWFLNHRTPEELREYVKVLSPAPRSVDITSEPLGVNLFLIAQR